MRVPRFHEDVYTMARGKLLVCRIIGKLPWVLGTPTLNSTFSLLVLMEGLCAFLSTTDKMEPYW